MQPIKLFSFSFSIILFISCGNLSSKQKVAATDSAKKDNTVTQLIDTAKIKSDMNNVMDLVTSAASGKQPDTNKLKATAADVLSTAAAVLSDSGINKMGGDKNDPSVQAAKNMLVRMRNASGITPASLDSMKKAVAELQENAPKNH
ncbi:MAG TPA: hypothetical protein VK787_16965 [Puia sp.]|jgi:hypothetical protein|nr:hypothetical protein [Puia sp.]